MSFEPSWIVAGVALLTTFVGLIAGLVTTRVTTKENADRLAKIETNYLTSSDIRAEVATKVKSSIDDIRIEMRDRYVEKTAHADMMNEMYRKFEMLGDKIDRLIDRFIDYSPPPPSSIPVPRPRNQARKPGP